MERLQAQLQFLTEIDKMKDVFRRNVTIKARRPENDAEHSWHMALCALVLAEYAPPGADVGRAIAMALVHDLVEVYAGDTFCYDQAGNATKAAREQAAADRIFGMLPADQGTAYRALWEEFDAMDTPDSQFAAAVDRLQPFILNVNTQGHTWRLGKITRAQLENRLSPIAKWMPALWPTVSAMIDEAVQQDLLPGG